MVLVRRFVALHAVAVRGKRRSPDAMAEGAGGCFRFSHAMLSLAVIEGRPRLRKDFSVADGAITIDAVVVELVGEGRLAVFVVENDGFGRGDVGSQRDIRFRYRSGLRRRLGRRREHEPCSGNQTADENHAENNLKGAHLFSLCQLSGCSLFSPGWNQWYLGINPHVES